MASALSPQPSLRVTVLGSGTSHGVPSIGCDCAVCRSTDPKDQRTRPSILLELQPDEDAAQSAFAGAVRSILVDTSTDLRTQALANDIRRVDAILFTHSHADHVFGLDDVRRFNQMQQGSIPCIAGAFSLGGVEIVPVPLFHGRLPVLGFRLGTFAYLTDCNRIPDESWPLLDGIRTIVLDALRHRPHSTHFSVSEAVAVVARLGAERAYLTHICHDLPHAETNAQLPAGVELAYDGLVLDVS